MARPGPPPKPTALKVLHGETRPSRLNAHEPRPLDGRPVPPPHLGPDALAVWEATLQHLDAMGLVTPADSEALAAYCEAVVQRRRAWQVLQASPPLIKGQRGNLVRNPATQAWRDAAMVMHRMSQEFGLTPAARAAWRGPASTDEDDARLGALLSG
jgi:P27 family predicted phage terminase small subunit